jgi:predicted phage terminase large subunit-like protein
MTRGTVASIIGKGAKRIDAAERSELVDYYKHYSAMSNEWLRRQIIDNNRIDILALEILGYKVEPFHLELLRFQFLQPDNLQLVFRGAGKSTMCTVTKSIHLLLKNPNLRILIASKTTSNAEAFLKEIKGHFEYNERLAEIFGLYYDPRLVSKWDNKEIEVLPRRTRTKEASITCVGVEGTIVSKHYDVVIADDLVDEDNSRTTHMRDKTKTWYYQTLDPTLEPPDDTVEHRGEYHRLGTRYHYDDLYGHLIENELAGRTQIIPALSPEGRSPWPEKYPPEWFGKKRQKSGIIIFNSQYQCDTEAMKGEVFRYDDCQMIEQNNLPAGMNIFMGVDLAISQEDSADHFAIVVMGVDSDKNRYVIDFYDGQLRFGDQTKKILAFYEKYDPMRVCIEINAYQRAQYHSLKDEDKDIRLTPVNQDKDKMSRAWKLTPLFEDGKMFFKKGGNIHLLIEQLVLFPSYRYKDLFDALDLAVRASKFRKRRKRRKEPGLI